MIEFYKEFGDLGYLANYSNHGFYKDGIYYKTVEHYYQSQKFDDEDIRNRIINAPTPKEASIIGRDRNNKRIENFKNIKNQVMYEGILEKFRQNKDIAYKLIETRNKDIAEATIDEYYWGIGKDKTGKNIIGKILLAVRKKIKEEILDRIILNCKGKRVHIIGHDCSDADSIFSSYILCNILKNKGIEVSFSILNYYSINENDEKLINDYLKEDPLVVDEDNYFILVDHNNIGNLKKENIIGAIDHHIITGEVEDIIEIEYASTALLIYDLFKDTYNFSEYEKELIYLTVLTDTNYFNSKRYSTDDKKLIDELNVSIDFKRIQDKYFNYIDFSYSIEDNLKKDYKEYVFDSAFINRSILNCYKKDYESNFDIYVNYIKDRYTNYLLIWCCYDSKETYIYYNEKNIKIDYILTSTMEIIKILKEKNIL